MKLTLTLEAFRNFLSDNNALGMFMHNLKNQGNRSLEGHWENQEKLGNKYGLISTSFIWPDEEVAFWSSLDDEFMHTFLN